MTRRACRDLAEEPRRRLLAEVARDYSAGATIAVLARRHNRNRSTIQSLLREAGVPLRQARAPAITGSARRKLADELRRRYEADRTLTVAALAQTVPYSYEVVRAMLHEAGTVVTAHDRPRSTRGPCPHLRGEPRHALLAELASDYTADASVTTLATWHHHTGDTIKALLHEAGVSLRPSTVSHHRRAQRHGMTDTEFRDLGLAVRHLYLTKIAGSGPLARFTGHPAVAIRGALCATGLSTRITYAPAPDRAFPEEEALALGALLWDRYRGGTTIRELATPLGPRAIPAITHALAIYATTHPETEIAARPQPTTGSPLEHQRQ